MSSFQVLKDHCDVISLNSGIDYRQMQGRHGATRYFLTSEPESNAQLDKIFKFLISQETDTVRQRVFTIQGRNVSFNKTCGRVLDTTFVELCDRPLGANDYLHLTQFFHTIIIRDVPQLSLKLKSQSRRFITLIDSLYDNKIRVLLSADVPMKGLFSVEVDADQVNDESRALMDDLAISSGDTNAAASIFTGAEEIFAFDRTLSRLAEMQTDEYWGENEY